MTLDTFCGGIQIKMRNKKKTWLHSLYVKPRYRIYRSVYSTMCCSKSQLKTRRI